MEPKHNNAVLTGRMQVRYEGQRERSGEKLLASLGDSRAVERMMTRYGKTNSKTTILFHLTRYLKFLREEKGVLMTPDELITDNLRCVCNSEATDVQRKRKHTDWLDEFVNRVLVERGIVDSSRYITASVVKQFYARNDSPMFGSFGVSLHSVRPPPPALIADDIRAVLKALPLAQRTPLLITWQSGVEINRVLGLTWDDVKGIDSGSPVKLQFYGRKKHRKPYFTYIGRDSVTNLKAWREKWVEAQKRQPGPSDMVFIGKGGPMALDWLNSSMKGVALRLARGGLVRNAEPRSWHSHYLRHSFETELSHGGMKAEIRDFFLGHTAGIQWSYNHRDELHEDDLRKEYSKVEPYISLEPDKVTIQAEFADREKSLVRRLETAESLLAELRQALGVSPSVPARAGQTGV
jgi:integrase